MIKKFFVFSLIFLIGCSSINFRSTNDTEVSFNFSDEKRTEVAIVVTRPFYMWGLVPEEQVVNVDEVFVRSGHANITDLQIKEIKKYKKALWMFFTFGMYYPQSFELLARVN